nr:potassium-transporting ATPase subunit KdpC [Cellulomonas massiliensis]
MRQTWAGLRVLAVLTLVLGLAYPLAVTAAAQVLLPWQAHGSLLIADGARTTDRALAVGSAPVGQAFTGPQWFHPRPSAAGEGYDTRASGGSNLGPQNPDLVRQVQERRAQAAEQDGVDPGLVPPDAVTASGSGLDPDISPAWALQQVPRVARERGLPEREVRALVRRSTLGRDLGVLGEPRVNVLRLNLALRTMAS